VPFSVATTFVSIVGWGTRWPFACSKGLFLYGHPSVRLDRRLLKFRIEPVTRCANAAVRIVLLGQSVARPKTHQLANRRFDVLRTNLRDDPLESARSWPCSPFRPLAFSLTENAGG
jgi:hypothetical protein